MRKIVLTFYLTAFSIAGFSQSSELQQINKIVSTDAAFEPLNYLASDDLKGRSPKRPEIDVAAKYISSNLKKAGAIEINGANDYYQTFEINLTTPVKQGSLEINESKFPYKIFYCRNTRGIRR